MNLQRLRNYINERVKESNRLEQWAHENKHYALANAHKYSALVGNDILEEIKNYEKNSYTEHFILSQHLE